MKKKIRFDISGKTVDGKLVVSGLFKIVETYGIPLTDALIVLKESDLVVDWIDYYESAVKSGMKSDRILERLKYNIGDASCAEHSVYVIKALKYHINRRDYKDTV